MNFKENLSTNKYLTDDNLIDSEIISSSLFSDFLIKFSSNNLFFEKRIKIKSKKSDMDIEEIINFLVNDKLLIERLFETNLDENTITNEFNLFFVDVLSILNRLALKLNYYIDRTIFDNIWKKVEEKKYLIYDDLNFINNTVIQKYIYVFLISETFLESYYFDKNLHFYLLYHNMSAEHVQKEIYSYLKSKNKFFITHKELRTIIETKDECLYKKYIEHYKTANILEEVGTNYIFTPLKFMFEETISKCLSSLKEDQYNTLKLRIVDNLTLSDVGQVLGKTRERIRQIEDKASQILSFALPKEFVMFIKELISTLGVLNANEIPLKDEITKKIIIHMLKTKLNFTLDITLNSFVLEDKFKYINILRYLKFNINDEIFSKEILLKSLKNLSTRLNFNSIIEVMITQEDLAVVDEKYFFKSEYKRKRDKVELMYLLSKDGFNTNTFDELYYFLEKYFPGEFLNENIRNILSVGQFTGNIILWDWGRKYIHIKHIKSILDEFDFTDLLNYLNKTLEITEQIDLQYYYEDNKDVLIEYGIISKYALHSLLKIKYPDEFSYHDSPWVAQEGTERRIIGDAIINLMDEKRVYVLDELAQRLQTTKTRVQQIVDKNDDILIVDTFMYMKKIYINFSDALLKNIIDFINKIIKDMQFIYINMIVEHFREELNCINAYNRESLMLDLLKKNTFQKEFQVSNTRIVHKDYPITRQSLNFHYVIESSLLQNNSSVLSKNHLFNFFTKRGLSKNNVMLYYLYSPYKSIVRKNAEEFIRLSALNISSTELEKINLQILEILDEETKIDDLLFMISDNLPKIQFEWNHYLLADLLDNSLFEFYPNRVEPLYIKIKQGEKEESL
ncbi:sigma factor-like helix-turn-helix DNA-binding protein [Aliarcobacter butzleri]|uniref:Sigma factor-like helix-turn-helix DNA-binding protein n=1 Tax=Aliarcobacter butzleri TaxID=28197 RepID=A0AAW7PSV7_9BACT|nr:sigma factor-like helix-turn-helix DNA-binding protein [Aliarcobacter butzleri]MDN5063920.1 sigma factor-like helix-turn-helix DNA-binding protein [Aliarcobacter butzleri]MDN5065154.1 sigma factor-like helix-turn-helix DNA-binding protein [Aliarcobacter butzleri]